MYGTRGKKRKRDWFPYLMLLPAWAIILGITAYPFVFSLALSFFDFSFLKTDTSFVGLKNYMDIISKGDFLATLNFTLLWTVVNVIFMTMLGFAVAMLMRQRFIGKGFLKATMLIPWILPQVVTGYVFNLMLSTDYGVVNKMMQKIGLLPDGFSWFSKTVPAMCAVFMANIWRGFPFIALTLFAKMQTVPNAQIEAASIDGAGAFQRFRYILLPYISPIALTCVLLTFLWSFNAFDIIKVMTDGGPLNTTNTLSLLVNREAFLYLEISRACTMAVIMLFILLACAGIFLLIRRAVAWVSSLKERRWNNV